MIAYYEKSRDILLMIREAGGRRLRRATRRIPRSVTGPLSIDRPGRRTHTEDELRPSQAGSAANRSRRPCPLAFETVDGFRMGSSPTSRW